MKKIELKDFIFYKYICKIYIFAEMKKNGENKDLYWNRDDFRFFFFFLCKRFYIL